MGTQEWGVEVALWKQAACPNLLTLHQLSLSAHNFPLFPRIYQKGILLLFPPLKETTRELEGVKLPGLGFTSQKTQITGCLIWLVSSKARVC